MPPLSAIPLGRNALLAVLALGWSSSDVWAQDTWTLTDDERRAFLHHYSPVILKRADEDGEPEHLGHDWLTNIDFDTDGDFSDNRRRWESDKRDFIAGVDHAGWDIQPTVYTALLEFLEDGEKSLILLYHVYHASQGGFTSGDVHDWERMEVRLDGVRPGGPGAGESASYYVLTAHSRHVGLRAGHHDLHFLNAGKTEGAVRGSHLLVWQAEWNGDELLFHSPPRKGELRFVEDNVGEFVDGEALVDISGHSGEWAFHYVFVDRDAEDAAAYWDARTLTRENAAGLVSGRDESDVIRTDETIRIAYELQDMADIFPTHHVDAYGSKANRSWDGPSIRIELAESIHSDLLGTPVTVQPGVHEFLVGSRRGNRRGYPRKHWFWGSYFWNANGNWTGVALATRAGVWNQHDYFLHDGERGEYWAGNYARRAEAEPGHWLPAGWHLPENGGFDGRWVSLFAD